MNRLIQTGAVCLLAAAAVRAADITITDADIVGNVTFTKDNTYILDGRVYVEDGESLTIQAGTVIKGKPPVAPDQPETASALIVTRGGKLYALGTATDPIIFTAVSDDVANPSDLGKDNRGLWGGVILLGRSTVNVPGGETLLEGFTDVRATYGGGASPNVNDSSGILRYTSIRHGGTELAPDEEINGLTFGAVGAGTVVEHVEVFANDDDAFEWFGGTVNTKYLIAAFNRDDSFDYDQGYTGKGQFWFSIQDDDLGNNCIEGSSSVGGASPVSMPQVANVTCIGSGVAGGANSSSGGFEFKENTAGKFWNSIITDVNEIVELVDGTVCANIPASLFVSNSRWFNLGAADLAACANGAAVIPGATFTNPLLRSVSRIADGGLDPRPAFNSPALNPLGVATLPLDGFFMPALYQGAFDPAGNWAQVWSNLSDQGFLPDGCLSSVDVLYTVSGLTLTFDLESEFATGIWNVDLVIGNSVFPLVGAAPLTPLNTVIPVPLPPLNLGTIAVTSSITSPAGEVGCIDTLQVATGNSAAAVDAASAVDQIRDRFRSRLP